VFDARALSLLVDVMGADRVLLGSDYPFPLGEQQVGRLVREHPTLPAAAKSAILGGNAASLFGIQAKTETRRGFVTGPRLAEGRDAL
jgi:aminocarboxymuconate-semialdehyde decarboxylase